MEANELIELRDELELILKRQGPVQFIRDLIAQSGAQVLLHDSQRRDDGGRCTRFRYCAPSGSEAFLTVVSRSGSGGIPEYTLECAPRSRE